MFSRVGRIKRSGWIAVGVVLGLVVAPVSALAAFTDVRVVGVFGTPPAAVTAANQLRVAETDPAQIRHYRALVGASCVSIPIPANNSFMVRTIEVNTYINNNPNSDSTVYVYGSKNCGGPNLMAETTALSVRQTETIPLEPGYPIPAGSGMSMIAGNNVSASVNFNGYLMPPSAVPAGGIAAQAKGANKEPGLR